MDNPIKISVIIPIYNAKDYISRCLESLLNQTLQEIEIICVSDCPTDCTDSIVDEYAKRDSRIIVIRNECNLHVAGSRNRGLEIARGEYIGFHDHDDYNCDIHMYEELYRKAIEDDADIVLSDAILRTTGKHVKDEIWRFTDIRKEALLSANILPLLKDINPQLLTHCVWSSIYRKELLNHHDIRFKDRQTYLDEDRLFNFEAYFNARKIVHVAKAYYVWGQLETSISHNYPSYLAEAQITRTQFYVDYLKSHQSFELYQKDLWTLVSLEMKIYLSYYNNLNIVDRIRLGRLMKSMCYPIFGYQYGLKMMSRKRVKLVSYSICARCLTSLIK